MKKRWQPKSLWPRCSECGLHARGPKCLSKAECKKELISFKIGDGSGVSYEPKIEDQETLWKAVSNEINDEGLWLYEDWDGFKITPKGIAYLKEQFTIARKGTVSSGVS